MKRHFLSHEKCKEAERVEEGYGSGCRHRRGSPIHKFCTQQLGYKAIVPLGTWQALCSGVQKLSNLATLDGCSHPEVATLGAAGNFGEQPGNCHRALVRSFCNQLSVPEPGLVTCKCFDPKTSKIIDEEVAIFYPHLMFSALAESYPDFFQMLFKLDELPEFGEKTLARDDGRLNNHSATLEKGGSKSPSLCSHMVMEWNMNPGTA